MVITREIREEIKNSVRTTIHSILSEENFIEQIVQKVSDSVAKTVGIKIAGIEKKISEMNKKFAVDSTVIKELKEETSLLESENEYLSLKYDEIDQRARSQNLRIFELNERQQENLSEIVVELFESRLAIKITKEDILMCTRVEKIQADRPRCILLNLNSSSMKQRIFSKKKMFKGMSIVLKEDLTENRLELMKAAIEKTSLRSVWSHDGNNYAMKDSKRIAIKTK
ncbi:unnamed protein product [Phaedon cochleariae]|uniref:Uncharacterized protein n=1 Tax=Phaedon cochleariae TaxID=80249 RepID=A0A9P0DG93_PHACE|nr:unnamed protein product [Phaedon cochleariae]